MCYFIKHLIYVLCNSDINSYIILIRNWCIKFEKNILFVCQILAQLLAELIEVKIQCDMQCFNKLHVRAITLIWTIFTWIIIEFKWPAFK